MISQIIRAVAACWSVGLDKLRAIAVSECKIVASILTVSPVRPSQTAFLRLFNFPSFIAAENHRVFCYVTNFVK